MAPTLFLCDGAHTSSRTNLSSANHSREVLADMAMVLWRSRPLTTSPGQVADRMVEQASVPFVLTQPQSTGGSIPGFQPLPVNLWETDEAWNAALILPGVEGHSLNV